MGLDIGNFLEENNHGQFVKVDDNFFNAPAMDIDENIIEEKPKIKVWNWKKSIACELMRGEHSESILNKYRLLINDSPNKEKILKYIKLNDGLLGYLFIDTSFFDNKFTYDCVPSVNKQYNIYAIHSPNQKQKELVLKTFETNADGTIDGFFNSSEKQVTKIRMFDEYTKLPVLNCIEDVSEKKLDGIAKLLLDQNKITLQEISLFKKSNNKLVFLKRLFRINHPIKITNAPVDDFSEYGLKDQKLVGKPISVRKNISIVPVEQKLDDIGKVSIIPGVSVIQKSNKSDSADVVDINTISTPVVEDISDMKLDDVGEIKDNSIDIDESGIVFAPDGNDVYFDEIGASDNKQDIDEEEFFSLGAKDDEIEYNSKPKKDLEISNKYEFGW